MDNLVDGKLVTHSSKLGVDELVEIAEGISYDTPKRIREGIAIAVFFSLTGASFYGLYQQMNISVAQAPVFVITVLAGMFLADFLSGLVHWTLDSWGSIETPFFGQSLMVPFREHHLDPTAFTRRDFLVTWGDLCIPCSIAMAFPTAMLYYASPETVQTYYYFILFVAVSAAGASTNNQLHKWAHMRTKALPKWVRYMQKAHIFLPIKHHHVHHQPPHMVKYCIINGWANYPLDFINFWRKLEWLIETITGWKPRQDDMKWSKKKQQFLKQKTELSKRLYEDNILDDD